MTYKDKGSYESSPPCNMRHRERTKGESDVTTFLVWHDCLLAVAWHDCLWHCVTTTKYMTISFFSLSSRRALSCVWLDAFMYMNLDWFIYIHVLIHMSLHILMHMSLRILIRISFIYIRMSIWRDMCMSTWWDVWMSIWLYMNESRFAYISSQYAMRYGVARISRLLKIIGLFCKRAL